MSRSRDSDLQFGDYTSNSGNHAFRFGKYTECGSCNCNKAIKELSGNFLTVRVRRKELGAIQLRSVECACLPCTMLGSGPLPVGRECGWAGSSWRHEKGHDAKHPKHHVIDCSRHRVSACKILTDR